MSFDENLVSVIMPAFNSSPHIDEAIKSVLSQDYRNWELLVVDDCSHDDTAQKVERWTQLDSRIKLLKNISNEGAGKSRNKGVANARGRYIAYLDSDDIWETEKLSVQLKVFDQFSTPLVFSSYDFIDSDGAKLSGRVDVPEWLSYKGLLGNTVIGCLTVMIDRNIVQDLTMPSLASRQTVVLWLRVLREHGRAKGVNQVLAHYRVRPGSISSNKLDAARKVWLVYRQYEGLSFGPASYYFMRYAWNAVLRNKSTLLKRRGR